MHCIICKYVEQIALNFLNLIDHTLNFCLLGDVNETVSARAARARDAGVKWAFYFCNFLTVAQIIVTFGRVKGDHCTYALNKKVLSNSREIWDWNTNSLLKMPETMIDDEEIDHSLVKNLNQSWKLK